MKQKMESGTGYFVCSSLSKKAWVNSRLAKQLVLSFLENPLDFPI
jgi:hypothetical protein